MNTKTITNLDRDARINMRISSDSLETLREAARAQQQDLTSFVLGAALDRARAVLVEDKVMRLTATESARLDEAMDREPRVIPELAALLREVKEQRVAPGKAAVRR